MSATRGVVAGVLGLSLLQAVLANAEQDKGKSGGTVAAAFTLATGAFRRVIDPAVPLIPDRRGTSSAAAPASYTQPSTSGGTYRQSPAGQAVIPA